MRFPSREIVDGVRKEYPVGTRVELVRMDDPQAPPVGMRGTVTGVDDTGSLLMRWDNGSGLNVVYGEDSVKKLDTVKVTCYGKTEVWDTRKEAADFYFEAICNTEGSECERYTKIYAELFQGKTECSDEYPNVCPRCGKEYTGHPALSRKDNKTYICPDCGTIEAMDAAGFSEDDKKAVMDVIHDA